MNKTVNQKPQDKQVLEILKKLTSRVEDATIDISSIKHDIKFVNLRLNGVEHNTEIIKVDMEGMKIDMEGMKADVESVKAELGKTRNQLEGVEERLGKRITNVADLITVSLGQKVKKIGKRVKKLEASSGINN